MSAEVVNALHAQAHRLDAEAGAQGQEAKADGKSALMQFLAKEFHELAERIQGRDPATVNAEKQVQEQAGGSGMSVQKAGQPGPAHQTASAGERLDVHKEGPGAA